jgi:hypothetical protein
MHTRPILDAPVPIFRFELPILTAFRISDRLISRANSTRSWTRPLRCREAR